MNSFSGKYQKNNKSCSNYIENIFGNQPLLPKSNKKSKRIGRFIIWILQFE